MAVSGQQGPGGVGVLGGSWVAISGVISRATTVVARIKGGL